MPSMQPKKLKESLIQRKTIEAFTAAGWIVVKNIQTNLNGWPDLTCYKSSVTLFIECKAAGVTKIPPLQEYRHKQLKQQRFTVIVINDINQIQNAITTGSHLLQR
jgi:Holliday junction resolvase